jgi:hypothetical protein
VTYLNIPKGQTSGSSRTVVADKGSFSEVSKGEVTNSELENGAESPDIAKGEEPSGAESWVVWDSETANEA